MGDKSEKTIDEKIERHVFVKYGSEIIDEKIGNIEDAFELKYIHLHNGSKQKPDNRKENYNKKMKIKPGVIYKFRGTKLAFGRLCHEYGNLEIITDEN